MWLGDLISCLPTKKIVGDPEVEIQGLAYHSQRIGKGFLFAAIHGSREDGKKFIPEALSRGAHGFLVNESLTVPGVAQVIVPDVREALARLSAAFYGNPSLSMTLVAITGTNGKTTTSYLIESILREANQKVGVMGTVNYRFCGQELPAPTTTPESLDLQHHLSDMSKAGITHVVLEVSSHALDLQRVRSCDFDMALFTNLTRDHLDYHGSMENYFRAKQRLFTEYLLESRKKKKFSIVNVDDPHGVELLKTARGTIWRFGVQRKGEVWPDRVEEDSDGFRTRILTPRGSLELSSPLMGRHNLYNILGAICVAEILEIPHSAIAAGIQKLPRVPGRLERVPGDDGIRVFVDYAHTGDALERALEALRQTKTGRLIVVFGCGGDRDRGKRPMMGRVAVLGSDLAIVTSDNPRTENPLEIIQEIEGGIEETGRKKYQPGDLPGGWDVPGYVVMPDRRGAIRLAIQAAQSQDVVLIAGKGHEDYQILGNQKIHFDDREEAVQALTALRRDKNR